MHWAYTEAYCTCITAALASATFWSLGTGAGCMQTFRIMVEAAAFSAVFKLGWHATTVVCAGRWRTTWCWVRLLGGPRRSAWWAWATGPLWQATSSRLTWATATPSRWRCPRALMSRWGHLRTLRCHCQHCSGSCCGYMPLRGGDDRGLQVHAVACAARIFHDLALTNLAWHSWPPPGRLPQRIA